MTNTRWNATDFPKYRQLTDPTADKVIADIIEQDQVNGINNLFQNLRDNDDFEEVDLPEIIKDYFRKTAVLPEWADEHLVAIGQEVFAAYGPQVSLLLLCKSLPEAYACANGALVLFNTGRMMEHNGNVKAFTRRLMETSQFVMNVCSPEGLEPNGAGIVTAQKVRLIHAAIRYYLINRNNWDSEKHGKPINQMDMAGTLQSFSTLVLQGLDILKIQLTEKEKEGFYHCWRIVGHIMGVEDYLVPATHQGGTELGEAILQDQLEASKEGKELTKAVIDFIAAVMPGKFLDKTPSALIKFLVRPEVAKAISVGHHISFFPSLFPKFLSMIFSIASWFKQMNGVLRSIVKYMNLKLLQGMLDKLNQGKVRFSIPPGLKSNWGLK